MDVLVAPLPTYRSPRLGVSCRRGGSAALCVMLEAGGQALLAQAHRRVATGIDTLQSQHSHASAPSQDGSRCGARKPIGSLEYGL